MGIFKKKIIDVPRRRRLNSDDSISASVKSGESFRRGRTLVGSILSNVDSRDAGRRSTSMNISSPRTHVHHLSIKRRKISGLLAISVMVIIILWLLISNFTATVIISCSDSKITKPINEKLYSEAIDEYFKTSPISRFSFSLDESALTAYVTSRLSEVRSVKRQGNSTKPGETDFIISFREPVAGWKINSKQFYVDAKGVSFDRNYYVDPSVQIVDNSGISPQAGIAIASKRFLGFVGRVVAYASTNGHQINQAVLPKDTTRELDVYFKNSNLYVKLSVDRPVGEQVEDMSRAIGYFVAKEMKPIYIDVRVSGKAFYKI